MNDLTILEFSIDKSNQTYVTEEALSYFDSIEVDLEQIANDIYKMQTGKDLELVPGTFEDAIRITNKIDELRKVMRHCNHNNSQNAKCVIGVKDILIKFKYIKALMLNGNELDYIMKIAKQERTIMDKVVTKSKMFKFVRAKMKQLGDEPR